VAGAAVALLAPAGWQVRTLAAAIAIGVVGFGLTQLAFLAVQEMLRP
jgi:hypothetical protein